MSYHPIHDLWLLARAKLKGGRKYYGAYLGGFPERARVAIGCALNEPLLHVCGGMARDYPYARGFSEWDETLDLDPACEPDHLWDAAISLPHKPAADWRGEEWGGILCDPPYSEDDAEHYQPGRAKYPNPNRLVVNALDVLPVGRKVGIIHYLVPQCPKNARFVFFAGVICGFNNRIRAFSVYERIA
jgi:hypothetical protein